MTRKDPVQGGCGSMIGEVLQPEAVQLMPYYWSSSNAHDIIRPAISRNGERGLANRESTDDGRKEQFELLHNITRGWTAEQLDKTRIGPS